MAKKNKANRTKMKKKIKRVNLNKLAKESIENDKKLKNKVNQTLIEYAKSKENMDLTRKIIKLNRKQKKKLAAKIKKKKKNLKKKSKSNRVKSGSGELDYSKFTRYL